MPHSNVGSLTFLSPTTAVLLVAHGSRRSEANHDLVELARQLRPALGAAMVEVSYLELATPTIPEGGRCCVEQGARQVLIMPYFLSAGTHVAADLLRIRDVMAASHPEVDFRICPPLGVHPLMIDIIRDRLAEGLAVI